MQYLEALSHRYLRERGNFHCDTNTFFFFKEEDIVILVKESKFLICVSRLLT